MKKSHGKQNYKKDKKRGLSGPRLRSDKFLESTNDSDEESLPVVSSLHLHETGNFH